MPRSIWNGALSFGLVNVPVQLFTTTEPKDIRFHQMTKSGHRARQKRVDEKTGREVEFRDIEKGYELSKGKVVLIDPGEIDAAAPEQTRRIDIEDFVDLAEIDPSYFDASYYIAPRSEGAPTRRTRCCATRWRGPRRWRSAVSSCGRSSTSSRSDRAIACSSSRRSTSPTRFATRSSSMRRRVCAAGPRS
jgi:hypothetical protein